MTTAVIIHITRSNKISEARPNFFILGDNFSSLTSIDFGLSFTGLSLVVFLLLCLVDFLEISSSSFLSSFFSRLLFLEADLLFRSADLLFRSSDLLFRSADLLFLSALLFLSDRGQNDNV